MTRFPAALLALLLALPAAHAGQLTIESDADSGAGTFRDAIEQANSGACPRPCEILFKRAMRIEVLSELPAITAGGVYIYTQEQLTVLDGARLGAGAAGLRLTGARDFQLRGVTFEHFDTGLALRDAQDIRFGRTQVLANRGDGIIAQRSARIRIEGSNVRGNGGHGIRLEDVVESVIAGNMIQNNGGSGIVTTGGSRDNYLEHDDFGGNGGLAIDIGDDGPSPTVFLDAALTNRGNVRVQGRLAGRPNARYDVSISRAEAEASGFGEGIGWVASGAPVITDAEGGGRFAIDFPFAGGTHVTALASRFLSESAPFGETSEFSSAVEIIGAEDVVFAVTSTADSGLGSLRAVLEQANASECSALWPCAIEFRIPSNDRTIRPLSPLPAITSAGLVIDGQKQIELDGASCAGCNGLEITSALRTIDLATIRGLAVRNFARHGIAITGYPRSRSQFVYRTSIERCELTANGGSGLLVEDAHVGSSLNLLSGNAGDGITVVATTDYGAGIFSGGDRIGTDRSGLFPHANLGNGIAGIGAGAGITAGGDEIAFNVGAGIRSGGPVTARANSIHSNGGRGIEREVELPLPVIESARFENGKTRLRYRLGVPPAAFPYRYRIDAFTSSFTDASGRGEAKRFLTSVMTNAEGSAEIELDENLTGKFVTLTRTTFDGFSLSAFGTSEFSESVQVTADNCAGETTTLVSPPDQSEGLTTFRWTAVPGAITYRLWAMKPGGGPTLLFEGLVPVATVALELGTYEWWVETRFECLGTQTAHRTFGVR